MPGLRVMRRSLGLLLAALGAASPMHAATARDTGRVVHRVVVSDQGIRYDAARPESATSGRHRVRLDGSVEIGGLKHKVHINDVIVEGAGGKEVRVVGPVVVVGGEDAGLVRVFSDSEVPAGKRIEGDVVAVFGSVTVKGQVAGSVVAVMGSVVLEPGASVEGDAVAVGGALQQAHGATVSGQSVSLGFLPISWGLPALPILLFVILLGWVMSLIMGWLFHLLLSERMTRVALTVSRRTALSLLLGFASAPLLVVAILLLTITVIGIPLAILLPVLYALMVWGGQLAASYVLGCRLLGRRPGEAGGMGALFAGTLFVAAFLVLGAVLGSGTGIARSAALFFYLLGALLIFGLTAVGTGAFLLSRFGSRPRDGSLGPAPRMAAPASPSAPPGPAGPAPAPAPPLPGS